MMLYMKVYMYIWITYNEFRCSIMVYAVETDLIYSELQPTLVYDIKKSNDELFEVNKNINYYDADEVGDIPGKTFNSRLVISQTKTSDRSNTG